MGWLDGLKSKVLGAAPAVGLGAFGKHPGWDDHIEPIGLDSEPLQAARDILYVRGIGGVIDGALWDKKPEETLPGIAHFFCWSGEADTLVGRMWSSTDGKGRARYPMAAVVHLGLPFSHGLARRAAGVLAGVEARCRLATTAPEVRAIFASGGEELRAVLAQPPDGHGAEADGPLCARLASTMRLNEGETFARALYSLKTGFEAFAREPKAVSGKINLRMMESTVPTQHSRLPAVPEGSVENVAFWQKVIAGLGAAKLPTLFIHPAGERWLDLVTGTPTPKQLFCIRANEQALPPAAAVPYVLDEAFRRYAADLLARVTAG